MWTKLLACSNEKSGHQTGSAVWQNWIDRNNPLVGTNAFIYISSAHLASWLKINWLWDNHTWYRDITNNYSEETSIVHYSKSSPDSTLLNINPTAPLLFLGIEGIPIHTLHHGPVSFCLTPTRMHRSTYLQNNHKKNLKSWKPISQIEIFYSNFTVSSSISFHWQISKSRSYLYAEMWNVNAMCLLASRNIVNFEHQMAELKAPVISYNGRSISGNSHQSCHSLY